MAAPELFERFARDEATSAEVYRRLAARRSGEDKALLEAMAEDEERHKRLFSRLAGAEVRPDTVKVRLFALVDRIFGFTFVHKLLEREEKSAVSAYSELLDLPGLPPDVREELAEFVEDERRHERAAAERVSDERLKYLGSVVLGLNDALVELSGSLAGFTGVMSSARLVALAGVVVGLAAALSMAASHYLSLSVSREAVEVGMEPRRAALYTGVAYAATVALLIAPFAVLAEKLAALALSLLFAIAVILALSWYTSVVFDAPLSKQLSRMVALSLGVAALTYAAGTAINTLFGLAL